MNDEIVTIKRNGLTLRGPAKPKKNDYVRVTVSVDTDRYDPESIGKPKFAAWNDAVSLAYDVYGATATEDGTVGQFAQCEGSDGRHRIGPSKGMVFSLGLNLWGKPAKKVWERINKFVKSAGFCAGCNKPLPMVYGTTYCPECSNHPHPGGYGL